MTSAAVGVNIENTLIVIDSEDMVFFFKEWPQLLWVWILRIRWLLLIVRIWWTCNHNVLTDGLKAQGTSAVAAVVLNIQTTIKVQPACWALNTWLDCESCTGKANGRCHHPESNMQPHVHNLIVTLNAQGQNSAAVGLSLEDVVKSGICMSQIFFWRDKIQILSCWVCECQGYDQKVT